MLFVTSSKFDAGVFIGLGFAVLGVHFFLSGRGKGSKMASFILTICQAAGLASFLFVSPLFVLLIGASFVAIMFYDSAILAPPTEGRRVVISATCMWMLAAAAALALLSSARWVAAGFGGDNAFADWTWSLPLEALMVLGLGFTILPWLVLLLLFSWILRPLLSSRFSLPGWPTDGDSSGNRLRVRFPVEPRLSPKVVLGAGLVLSAFVGAYPYLPAINPSSTLVGTDVILGYSCGVGLFPISTCVYQTAWDVLRIGAVWFLRGISTLVGSAQLALELAPAVLGILFVLSTFILVKEGTNDSVLAGVSALFASVSTGTVVGIDAGIYANWLALSVAYLFFALFLRARRKGKALLLLPAAGLFVALLAIHPWTWFFFLGVLMTYLFVDLVQAGLTHTLSEKRIEMAVFGLSIGAGLLVLVEYILQFGGGALIAGFQTAISNLSLSNVSYAVPNLQKSLILWTGGGETNSLWFVLGTVGVLAVPSVRGRFSKLLITWLVALAASVVLVEGPLTLMQERLLYYIPLQVFAAIGVMKIASVLQANLPWNSFWLRGGSGLVLLVAALAAAGLALGFTLEYVGILFG